MGELIIAKKLWISAKWMVKQMCVKISEKGIITHLSWGSTMTHTSDKESLYLTLQEYFFFATYS